jgi:hypothetical protein
MPHLCFLGFGLELVRRQTEKMIMSLKGLRQTVFRCKTASDEHAWLSRNATSIMDVTADDNDPNYSMIDAVMSDVDLNRFKKTFSKVRR